MKKATAVNDVDVIRKILNEFLGNRKAAKVAEIIYAAMQDESQHSHKGQNFFVHKDNEGKLVLTMESAMKESLTNILKQYLEKEDVKECCAMILSRHNNITDVKEYDSIKIYGSNNSMYEELLNHKTVNNMEVVFMNELKKAINNEIEDFNVFVCDPSLKDGNKLVFTTGQSPAIVLTYNQNEQLAKANNVRLGKRSEYILFLATILLKLIQEGWTETDSWNAICSDSKNLGHYQDSANSKNGFESTGARIVAGKADLANTFKILAKEDENGGYWIAGGCCADTGSSSPLANLQLTNDYSTPSYYGVGWFVF